MPQPQTESHAWFGDTLPGSKWRLTHHTGMGDPEVIMMKLWEEENVRGGIIPVAGPRRELFTHQRTPIEAILLLNEKGGLSGEITERDRQVVNAVVQWFATNCGRALHEEFRERTTAAYRKRHNLK